MNYSLVKSTYLRLLSRIGRDIEVVYSAHLAHEFNFRSGPTSLTIKAALFGSSVEDPDKAVWLGVKL